MPEVLDAVLRSAVERGQVPNVVAVAADAEGLLYAGAAGPRHAAAGGGMEGDVASDPVASDPVASDPVSIDSGFRIASMTKIVTTVVALQLAERGELELDAPVCRYLPEFARLRVLEGFDGNVPRLRAPRTAATVRQLMTHTSGLAYWFWNAAIVRWERATGTPNVLGGRLAALTAPMVADPGSTFEYGVSTDWLGRVVESVTGEQLPACVEQQVTGPLGMTRTSFTPTPSYRAGLVPVHRRGADGRWTATGIDWPAAPQWWSGGHGLYSTAGDFLVFQRALLRGGEVNGVRILREDTVDQMFTNQLGPLRFPERIVTAHAASSADLVLGPGLTWGLGLLLTTAEARWPRATGSGSWAGIFNTHFWIDRRRGLAGAVYAQTLPFVDPGFMTLYRGYESAVYARFSPCSSDRRSPRG